MYLQHFSTELLTKIFEYCEIKELYSLQQTCKRFYEIIRAATTLGNVQPFLVTNQLRHYIRKRSLKLLTLTEKYATLKNWERGIFHNYCLLKERTKFMPKIVLTKDLLWISKGKKIFTYKRNNIGISLHKTDATELPILFESDISTFIFKENCIITGQSDGDLYVKKSNEKYLWIKNAHDSDVHSVDLLNNNFVSGSKSGCLKIWNLQTCETKYCWQDIDDRIWAVALSKCCQYIGVGTAKNNDKIPLYIFDIDSCKVVHKLGGALRKGTGLTQLKWESPYILLSSGYDGNIHQWDLRCDHYVSAWRDPFLAPVFCFDTDDYCTLVTGLAYNGRTVLWDMRMTSYIQMYFTQYCKKRTFSSPIYSLAFDVAHLFVATDYNLNILNFSDNTGKPRNYDKVALQFLA